MVEELDPSVIDEMIAGNAEAFQQILRHHIGPITGYVMRMTRYSHGVGNHLPADTFEKKGEDIVEDIVQETFVRLWEKRQRYDPKRARLTTWLHRIAHNLCVDHFRRSQRTPINLDINGASLAETEAQTSDSDRPDRRMAQQNRAILLRRALMALPEKQRSALVMCHYQGLSNKETAEITGMSVAAVESLLARARKKLKQDLLHLQE